MADKLEKPKPSNKKQRFGSKDGGIWRGFVKCSFTEHWRSSFEDWCESHPWIDCVEFIAGQLVDEFKFSAWFDVDNDCYVAGLTGTKNAAPRCQGLMLTARGGSIETAIQALVFKHVEMVKGDYEQYFDEPQAVRKGTKFVE